MPNFAVACTPEGKEKADGVLKKFQDAIGGKQEDALLRIMDLADSESVRGTHPELEESLRSVDTTIATLIKQINGIVAGQDGEIMQLRKRIDEAVSEKNAAVAEAEAKVAEANKAIEEANQAAEKAVVEGAAAARAMKENIDRAQKEAQAAIDKAEAAASRASQERDDARVIADEKTKSNDMLLGQLQAAQEDLDAYKVLQEEHRKLQEEYRSSVEAGREAARNTADKHREELATAAEEKRALETDLKAQIRDLREEISSAKKDAASDLAQAKAAAELEKERAVIAKERELRDAMQEQIQAIYRENARLLARIEQLEGELKK